MPPKGQAVLTDADHLIFLTCCVRNAKEDVKPDFQKVANELGIRTAAAAHKRFYRLIRNLEAGKKGAAALPATPSSAGLPGHNTSTPTPSKKKRKTSSRAGRMPRRKRKVAADGGPMSAEIVEESDDDGDEEVEDAEDAENPDREWEDE